MKHHFVKTKNYSDLLSANSFMEDRGSLSSAICLCHGEPGVGKTRTFSHWAGGINAVFIRGHVGMTLSGLRWIISDKLGVRHRRNVTDEIEEQIATIRASGIRLIFDEAHFGQLMRYGETRAAGIEYVRDLAERSDSFVVLICHNSEVAKFSESPHIRSRIAFRFEMNDAEENDAVKFIKELCEVRMTDEVAKSIYSQTRGKFRLMENAIASLERIAKQEKRDCVEYSHIANTALIVDYEQTLVPRVSVQKGRKKGPE